MKLTTASAIVMAAALALTPALAMAQDGGALYGTKCKMCHGDAGQGKMGPKLAGTSKSEADIVKVLTTGGLAKAPHIKPVAGLTPDQASSIAKFVKGLK